MAIAFDAVSKWNNGAASSITFAHTCTGSDRLLRVDVTNPFTDILTGVTYAGVSMTQLWKIRSSANNWWCYTFILINPASGTNNIVVTASASATLDAWGISYTWCDQTTQPDSFAITAETFVSTYTQSTTVINTNCWLSWFFVTNAAQTAWTWYTIRDTSASQRWTHWDSNWIVWTWSVSMSCSTGSTRYWVWTVLSISPSIASTFIPRVTIF